MKRAIAMLLCLLAGMLWLSAAAEGEWAAATVVNCEEWVSLREAPSTAAPRLIQVPLGDRVWARVFDSQFAECEYKGLKGYILLDYLTLPRPETPVATGSGGMLIPNVSEFLSLRASASEGGAVLERILPGAMMEILGWSGDFARVRALDSGKEGFVHSGYVQDAAGDFSRWPYDYDCLMADVARLEALGAEQETIALSLDGRAIPALRFGSGERHILIQGGIHGREIMTGRLTIDLLANLMENHPGGVEDTTFHVIPVANPDGLEIAIHGPQAIQDPTLRAWVETLLRQEGESHTRWKANARGVDLNRNFETGWQALTGRAPGSSRYRGEAPLSEPESQALAAYLSRYPFSATVSYHSYGSLLYWQGAEGAMNEINRGMTQVLSNHTGYPMEENELSSVERGGFKDWALMDCNIPSVTVETGAISSEGSLEEYTAILLRNQGSWEKLAQWVNER